MSLDNNGQPLPQGYGPSFDYPITDDDEAKVPLVFVFNEGRISSPFRLITRTLVSERIMKWYYAIRDVFMSFEPHVRRVEGTEAGIGGTYFFARSDGAHLAVFKPSNEEHGAGYNPPGSDSSTSRIQGTQYNSLSGVSTSRIEGTQYSSLSGVSASLIEGTHPQAGKGAAREIAAYLLDHPTKSKRREGFVGPILGFCRVPVTVPVSCIDKAFYYTNIAANNYVQYKFGSLQMFMENSGNCRGMDDDELLEDDDVQKLCLLDMRFANGDRHLGNLLKKVKDDGRYELIPIDHGRCFPDNFKGCYFGWLQWNKTKKKFSQEIVEYIESLDSKADIELLIKEGFTVSYTFARTLAITTMLLKEGVNKGLSPFEIAHFMCEILPNNGDEDYLRVKRAVLLLVGDEQLQQISALQKTVLESIAKLVVAKLGKQFRGNEEILNLVEKESHLEGMDMTKQQVEDELLKIVFKKLRSKIKKYADALRGDI